MSGFSSAAIVIVVLVLCAICQNPRQPAQLAKRLMISGTISTLLCFTAFMWIRPPRTSNLESFLVLLMTVMIMAALIGASLHIRCRELKRQSN